MLYVVHHCHTEEQAYREDTVRSRKRTHGRWNHPRIQVTLGYLPEGRAIVLQDLEIGRSYYFYNPDQYFRIVDFELQPQLVFFQLPKRSLRTGSHFHFHLFDETDEEIPQFRVQTKQKHYVFVVHMLFRSAKQFILVRNGL